MAVFWEHANNKPSGFIKGVEILDYLLLKKYSAPWG
jgi:hypothetical protein